jgi:hypothetical protein
MFAVCAFPVDNSCIKKSFLETKGTLHRQARGYFAPQIQASDRLKKKGLLNYYKTPTHKKSQPR